jgi:hypothetical protein
MRRQRIYSYQSLQNSRQKTSRRRSLFSQKRVRHYAEPLFSKKTSPRRPPSKFSKKIIKSLALIVCMFVGIGVLVYIPYFRIKKITTQGFKNVSKSEFETFVKTFLPTDVSVLIPKNNYFVLNTQKIEEEAIKKFSLSSVKIKKKFPDTLSIEIEERGSKAIVFTGNNYYLIDETGTVTQKILRMINPHQTTQNKTTSSLTLASASNVIPTISSTPTTKSIPDASELGKEYSGLPIIFYPTEGDLIDTEKTSHILSTTVISSIISWKDILEKNKIAPVKYFLVNIPKAGMEIHTSLPWKIHVDPEANQDTQFESLKAIVKNFTPQEYADVRYEGRVYWK